MSLASDIRIVIQGRADTVLVCDPDACVVIVASSFDATFFQYQLRMFVLTTASQEHVKTVEQQHVARRAALDGIDGASVTGSIAWNNYHTDSAGLSVAFAAGLRKLDGESRFIVTGKPMLFNLGVYNDTPGGHSFFCDQPALIDNVFKSLCTPVQESVT